MDLLVESSRSGSPTCRYGPIHLHSPYSPEREAERFIQTLKPGRRPTTIVLLGPCLDYLSPRLKRLYPGSFVISLQYLSGFRNREFGRADASWYPDSPEPLDSFLDALIDEDAVSGILVLAWAPAEEAFPQAAAETGRALYASLARLTSSAATVKVYGRRWFANACRSFLLVRRIAEAARTGLPVVIAAAGPSLGAALAELAGFRGRFALLAVSSSLAACRAMGMEPDLVVASDGGAWSRPHLYPLAASPSVLAAPLTALPSAALYASSAFLPLRQASFVEAELCPLLGGGIELPPHGTVAGTAIQLAARLCTGPIILAGLDLAACGESEHAAPHAFDHYVGDASLRLDPREGRAFSRRLGNAPLELPGGLWHGSRSLAAYAGALVEDGRPLAGRLFRLKPSPIALEGFETLEAGHIARVMGSPRSARSLRRPSPFVSCIADPPIPEDLRETLLRARFASWRETASQATAALGEGLLPGKPAHREFLRSIDLPDWAAARRASIAGEDPRLAAKALADRVDAFLVELQRRLLG